MWSQRLPESLQSSCEHCHKNRVPWTGCHCSEGCALCTGSPGTTYGNSVKHHLPHPRDVLLGAHFRGNVSDGKDGAAESREVTGQPPQPLVPGCGFATLELPQPWTPPAVSVSVADLHSNNSLGAPFSQASEPGIPPPPPPCKDRETPPVLSLLCHLDAALATPEAFHPVTTKQERVFGEEKEFFCVHFWVLFSLQQHRINTGDSWRAFKCCVTKGRFPCSSRPGSGSLGEASTAPAETWQCVCSHSLSLFSSPSDPKASSSWAGSWLWLVGSDGTAGGNQALPFLG